MKFSDFQPPLLSVSYWASLIERVSYWASLIERSLLGVAGHTGLTRSPKSLIGDGLPLLWADEFLPFISTNSSLLAGPLGRWLKAMFS